MENVVVEPDKDRTVSIALEPGEASVTVGIYTEEPMIDMSVAGPTPTVITRKMIDRIPGGRPF